MWQRVGERVATSCIAPTVKHGGGSVMVWGDFANCWVRDLHQVKGKLNQIGYHSILQHHMIPSGTCLMSQGFILMQNNDQKHTSKICLGYIKSSEEQYVLQLISWLAQLADLNSIGLMRDEHERCLISGNSCGKVGQNYVQFTSRFWWKEFWEPVKQW